MPSTPCRWARPRQWRRRAAFPGRWSVTILAGEDTLSDTPAGRLGRVDAERSALADRCRTDAKGENPAARRRDEPAPSDQRSGLPLLGTAGAGDGFLVVLPDGRWRVEQRTQTEAGELTLWGSRIRN